jgi:hypothetical protein
VLSHIALPGTRTCTYQYLFKHKNGKRSGMVRGHIRRFASRLHSQKSARDSQGVCKYAYEISKHFHCRRQIFGGIVTGDHTKTGKRRFYLVGFAKGIRNLTRFQDSHNHSSTPICESTFPEKNCAEKKGLYNLSFGKNGYYKRNGFKICSWRSARRKKRM